jgi:hypothetical protein
MWAAVSCSCTGCTVLCQTAVSRIVQFSKKAPVRLRESENSSTRRPLRPRVYHARTRSGTCQRCLRTELTPVFRFPSYALLMRSTTGIFVRIFVWMAPM